MGHIEGESREQRQLLVPSLDEMLAADAAVRVIDAFVDTLDLGRLGFSKAAASRTGRPPFRPGDLLKLYIYGYSNQMRSSRRLEREAWRNIEVQWLINRLQPCFKTICDFRKEHASAIVEVTRAFIAFCRGQSLFGGALVAIDGSKVEAVASRRKVLTPKRLAKRLTGIDKKIAAYLAAMDEADRAEEAQEASSGDVKAALEALKRQREEVQDQARMLAEAKLTQQVDGEEEARLMKGAHGYLVAYNAQTAVDDQNGLIAAFDLTNECSDACLLLPMATAAKEALEAETLTVVADAGYSNGEQGKDCAQAGIIAAVPRPETVNPSNAEMFKRDAFQYDEAGDSWTCPAGQTLTRYKRSNQDQSDYYRTKACGGCALKPRCTTARYRSIARHFHEVDREIMHRRTVEDPSFMKRRRELAEHPFGIIKWMLGHPRFLLRGLKKAKAELALAVLGFNLKRTIKIKGVLALLASLKPQPA
jgi:transposase